MDPMKRRSGEMEFRTVGFRAGTGDGLAEGEFDGHAAVFNSLDHYFTIFLPGCFAESLPAFRDSGFVAWQHNWDQPIGKPLDVHEDATGLYVRAAISDVQQGREALTLMRDGVIKKLSFGFRILQSRDMTEQEGIAMLGELEYYKVMADLPWWTDAIELIEKVQLYEISPVSVPGNDKATITGVRDSSLAGLTLGDHSETALAVVEDWMARMKSFTEMKTREGRVLSTANRDKLVSMRSNLGDHCDMLDELLAATEPKDEEADRAAEAENVRAEARRLYAGWLRSEAADRGVIFAA